MKHFLVAMLFSLAAAGAPTPSAQRPFALGRIPVYFEPNFGQFPSEVRFLSRGANYRAVITDSELVLQMRGGEASRIRFGKQKPTRATGLDKFEGISNYFLGQDPRQWVTNVPNYAKAKLEEVYPGIDIVFYAQDRNIEYDFIVKPGADPNQIELNFPGRIPLHFEPTGLISLRHSSGTLTQQPPRVYQGPTEVAVRPTLTGRTLRFAVDDYDPRQELVVDPTLVYSTYVGGNRPDTVWDQDAHQIATKVRVDAAGNLYFAGLTYANSQANTFPTTSGALRTTAPGGVSDGVVIKLNPTGTALLFSTYLGSSGEDYARGIALDASGNVYVAGTGGTNFPTTAGSFQPTRTVSGQLNLFVTKLNSTGSALLYSTFVGSAGGTVQAIEVNAANEAIVASATCPPPSCAVGQGLPTPLVNPAQAAPGGNFSDATLFKLNAAGSALVFSTYHGAGANDWATALALGPTGDIFVTGSGAVAATSGAFAGTAGSAVWLAKFTNAGALSWNARIGGVGNDRVNAIAVDSQNQPIITGQSAFTPTPANLWPVTAGTIQPSNPSTCSNHFLTKFNANGTALAWSTFLAGKVNHCSEGYGLAVDPSDNVWVLGLQFRSGGVAPSFPVTGDALQSDISGNNDLTIAKVNPTATSVLFGSYLGGTGLDFPHGIALDSTGANVWVAGAANYTGFPVTSGAFQSAAAGDFDLVFAKLSFPLPPVNVTVNSAPTGLTFSATGTGCDAGTGYTASRVLSWLPASNCQLSFATPQAGSAGTQYVFTNWEDASTNPVRSLTAPNTATTYTATFKTQHLLTTAVSGPGTVSPATGYQDAGPVNVTATPGCGVFTGWTGATVTSGQLNLTAPTTLTANFSPAPAAATALKGSLQTLRVVPVRYRQAVSVLNTTGIAADITIILDGLGSGVTLAAPASPTGVTTTCTGTAGRNYYTVTGVAPGAYGTVTFEFSAPNAAAVSYTPSAFVGPGPR